MVNRYFRYYDQLSASSGEMGNHVTILRLEIHVVIEKV